MHFEWSSKTVGQWRDLLKRVPRSNCMQSWPYAKAVRMSDQKTTRLAVILHQGVEVGMMAIQEVRLGPIHFVNLYRGPLWFQEPPPEKWIELFTEAFDKEFPKRLFRRRRWLPEWKETSEEKLKPFVSQHQKYQTAWLELNVPQDQLRAQLKGKWRNALNKSEKSSLIVEVDWSGQGLQRFLYEYQRDRISKKYHGPSVKFVKEEFLAAKPFKDGFIVWAFQEGHPVAAIFILMHGQCASYRIGWTTEEGRKWNAHNRLLWEAILVLKERKIVRLDLGGLDSDDNKSGLNKFKIGTGAKVTSSPGMLR